VHPGSRGSKPQHGAMRGKGRDDPNVTFHEVDKGGHFAALEELELFTTELRDHSAHCVDWRARRRLSTVCAARATPCSRGDTARSCGPSQDGQARGAVLRRGGSGLPVVCRDRWDTRALDGLEGTSRTRARSERAMPDTAAHGGTTTASYLKRVGMLDSFREL
jgi:hypothetical protein